MSRLIMALLCLSTWGCDGAKVPAGLSLTDVVYGGCAGEQLQRATPDSGDSGEPESLTVTADGPGTIQVLHLNVPDECCLEHEIALSEAGTTLTVEYEAKGDPCDCICSFDYSFTVSGLEPGTWTVQAGNSSSTVQVD